MRRVINDDDRVYTSKACEGIPNEKTSMKSPKNTKKIWQKLSEGEENQLYTLLQFSSV